ncbi:tyrosine--tRNA ligase [Patescibacteria group bacterium]|nr:tyrosine--tRNA ligase [Patescibacteria group bacterium]
MDKVGDILTRGVEKVLPSKEGLGKLMNERKIKLYQGFDPTGRLHLGHTSGLRKLMAFAELGHNVTFLFGTGTVLVGDPSQRESKRKVISQTEIKKNISSWRNQASPVVDFKKIKIRENGEWLTKLKLSDIVSLASKISATQLFKRRSFQQRLDRGDTVWYHETMYPLLQGYDSVVLDVDLEIGGTDQEFNMLIGRELQKKINKREKYILTLKMIMGTNGKPMSKSSGNCIWLDEVPYKMFGQLMSIPDSQIDLYVEVLTDLPLKLQKEAGPLKAKKQLAFDVVSQIHGKDKAKKAQEKFEKTFQRKKPEYETKIPRKKNLAQSIAPFTSLASVSDAKRYISQGAVDVNQGTVTDPTYQPKAGDQIRIGTIVFGTVVEDKKK